MIDCPKCTLPSETDSGNEDTCNTCNNKRRISKLHNQLLQFNFKEVFNSEHKLYLNKVIGIDRTVNIELLKQGQEFAIISCKIINTSGRVSELDSLEQVIQLLSNS